MKRPVIVHPGCALVLLAVLLQPPTATTAAERPQAPTPLDPPNDPHVCIIGGGIAAASTAHFLSQVPTPPRMTVFEKTHRLGGRVRTLSLPHTAPVEAGASIIASANRLMRHFVETLNLSAVPEPDGAFGLWNGSHFVFRSRPSVPATLFALAWRYRLSLLRMQRLVNRLLRQYDTLYPQPALHIAHVRPVGSVPELFASAPELFGWSQRRLSDVVAPLFSARFTDELVSAIVRVNYGQEVDAINALAGAIGLAGSGAELWAVGGGNEQVIRGLLERSGATIRLNTTVRALTPTRSAEKGQGGRGYTLSLTRSASPPDNPAETPAATEADETLADAECDAVVLAAPYELCGMTVPRALHERLEVSRTFQQCVATFVRGVVRNTTFGNGGDGGGGVTEDILTTRHGDASGFLSVTPASHNDKGARGVWKVFSQEALTAEVVRRVFEDGAEVVRSFEWRAYPKYEVPQRFVRMDVDGADGGAFVYTSAVESGGSAMEMSALAGMNAAGLVCERLGVERAVVDGGGDGGGEKTEL